MELWRPWRLTMKAGRLKMEQSRICKQGGRSTLMRSGIRIRIHIKDKSGSAPEYGSTTLSVPLSYDPDSTILFSSVSFTMPKILFLNFANYHTFCITVKANAQKAV
jgi:hypothetical protein